MNWQAIGKYMMIGGGVLFVLGILFFYFGRHIPRFPGDIFIQKGNVTFYFPIVTCLIISIVLSLISWFFRH